jgi:hypothetical protein
VVVELPWKILKFVTISFDITYYHEYSTRCARGC